MNKFIKILAIVLICGFAQNAHAMWNEPERLTDPVAIKTLKNVRSLFFSTQEKVKTCLRTGRPNKDCFCESKKEYGHLQKVTDRMFEKYPRWNTAFELRYIDGDTVKSIMPQELKRQVKFKRNCFSYIFL